MILSTMEFIIWHYIRGWKWYWKRFWFNVKKLNHFFSFEILLRSLFLPWKRITSDDDGVGFDLAKFFENLSLDLISITIGAMVRLVLIVCFLVSVIVYCIWSMVWFLVWWAIPFLGWKYYLLDIKNFKKELNLIGNNIRNNPKIAGQVILNSDGGKFILKKLEKNILEVIKKIQINKEDLVDFDNSSWEGVMRWFLSKNNRTESDLQQLDTNGEEVVLAARWWDERQSFREEKKGDSWELGRPGIGWGLLFGFTPNLDKYSDDLSIKQNFSSHLIGREKIVEKMEKIINSGKNILLVGDPGVGKMTVVYAFADKAIRGKLGKELVYKKLILFPAFCASLIVIVNIFFFISLSLFPAIAIR